MNFVLLHGAWHDGRCWAQVAKALVAQGHHCFCPTLPGHGGEYAPKTGLLDCIEFVSAYIDELSIDECIIVAHSFSGVLAPHVAEKKIGRVSRLIFQNAMVLAASESILDVLPPDYQQMMLEIKAASEDGNWFVDFEMFANACANTATEEVAREIFADLSPSPLGMQFEKIAHPDVRSLPIAKSYINFTNDIVLPHGEWAWYPRMGDRLGQHRLVQPAGDHEACYTTPDVLAEAILQAAK